MSLALVTGANRGIGLELCRLLVERGDEVIGVCRSTSPELDALGVRVESGLDVGEDVVVEELRRRFEGVELDLVINNAGILQRFALDALDFESARQQYEVNALGPLRVCAGLLGCLGKGSKVGLITSRMGSIADNDSGGHYGYRMSKAALNAAGKSLALDLHSQGVAIALLHPGWVRTDMTRGNGLIDAPEAARGLLARLDALTLENSGGFWHQNGEELPW